MIAATVRNLELPFMIRPLPALRAIAAGGVGAQDTSTSGAKRGVL
jgi:hypothetical protein